MYINTESNGPGGTGNAPAAEYHPYHRNRHQREMDIRVRRFQVEQGTTIQYFLVYWNYNTGKDVLSVLDRVAVIIQKG